MNGYDQARAVEAAAWERLAPFFEEQSDGRYVLTDKGRLAKYIQEVIGDVVYNAHDGRMWTVEIKAERRHTGNLFLETWSNKNLDDRDGHSYCGSNVGWLYKLRSDLLFYYFLDNDNCYVFDLFKLKRWAFGSSKDSGQIHKYPERRQGKHVQKNDTHARLVPIEVLRRECGFKLLHPRQIELFAQNNPAAGRGVAAGAGDGARTTRSNEGKAW